MTKSRRHIGQTPGNASLVPSPEAVGIKPTGQSDDTAYMLKGEGTRSKDCTHSIKRIISPNIRVPVISKDGKPLMPTKASRAKKWIKNGRAIPIRTKLGLFAVRLSNEASGNKTQPIVVGLDPGSKFSGVAVCSKSGIHCGFNLELPDWVNKRMEKRSELRKHRKYRNRRKHKKRYLNKKYRMIPPTIKSKREFEIRVISELCKIFNIPNIAYENSSFNKSKQKHKKHISHVEGGKQWCINELSYITSVNIISSWEQHKQRLKLGLNKSKNKSEQTPESHVNDSISLSSILLGDIILNQNYHFGIIRRPRYKRRKLHCEQPSKGGVRKRTGGTTTPFIFRKGDYVESKQKNKTHRGWVSGYSNDNRLCISDFDWHISGRPSIKNVKLLHRNNGILQSIPNLVYNIKEV